MFPPTRWVGKEIPVPEFRLKGWMSKVEPPVSSVPLKNKLQLIVSVPAPVLMSPAVPPNSKEPPLKVSVPELEPLSGGREMMLFPERVSVPVKVVTCPPYSVPPPALAPV